MTEMTTQPTENIDIRPDIGLDAETHNAVTGILATLLADEFVLYTKLRKYHWNVTGPAFHALHTMFEEQYEDLAEVIDDVAERLRAYGVKAPGTLAEFQEKTRLSEHPGENPTARNMVVDIVADHEALVRFLRQDIEAVDEHDDDGAEDFLTGLLQKHQEHAWMLRAMLEGPGL
jgi:starvation-inducible DNA-binding protein